MQWRCVDTPRVHLLLRCQLQVPPPAEVTVLFAPFAPPQKPPNHSMPDIPYMPDMPYMSYQPIPSSFCTVYVHRPLSAPLLPARRDLVCLFEELAFDIQPHPRNHHVLSAALCHGGYYVITTIITAVFIINITSLPHQIGLPHSLPRPDPFSRSPWRHDELAMHGSCSRFLPRPHHPNAPSLSAGWPCWPCWPCCGGVLPPTATASSCTTELLFQFCGVGDLVNTDEVRIDIEEGAAWLVT